MTDSRDAEGLAWQVGVWNRMAPVYAEEVDQRFIPVVDQVLLRAKVQPVQVTNQCFKSGDPRIDESGDRRAAIAKLQA